MFLTILAVLKLSAHKHNEHCESLEVCRLKWDYIPDSTSQVTLLSVTEQKTEFSLSTLEPFRYVCIFIIIDEFTFSLIVETAYPSP